MDTFKNCLADFNSKNPYKNYTCDPSLEQGGNTCCPKNMFYDSEIGKCYYCSHEYNYYCEDCNDDYCTLCSNQTKYNTEEERCKTGGTFPWYAYGIPIIVIIIGVIFGMICHKHKKKQYF